MTQPSPSPSEHSHRRHWLRWLVLGAMIVGAVVFFRGHGEKPASSRKRPTPVVSIAPGTHNNLPVYKAGLGTVQAFNTVVIRTRIDGQLMDLPFREGDVVHAGDVLARLDDRTFKAQYHQALANKARSEAQLANARIDLNRYKQLGNSISKQVLDTQYATVRQLEATVQGDDANVQNTYTQLSFATITSPITGRTGIRQVDVGNIIRAGDANGIVTIAQIEPISVLFSLPQQQLDAINEQLDQQHTLRVEALAADNKTVIDTGVLELVDNQIDAATGTIRLKATFPNTKHKLWPGGFTNVRLLLATNENAFVVPTVAIQHGPQGAYVFVYKADAEPSSEPKTGSGSVVMTPVTVGITVDDTSEILSGLNPNDKVVIDGTSKLQDKSRVNLLEKPVEPSKPLATESRNGG